MAYLCMCSWAGLTQPISLFDGYAQSLVDRFDQFTCERRCTGVEHAQSAEIILVDNRMLSQQKNDWGHNVCKSNLAMLDVRAELFNIELSHDYSGKTAENGLMDLACKSCLVS